MISSRRSFLAGLNAALFVAPAIVRASSIMPVKQMLTTPAPIIWDDCLALLQARLDAAESDPARLVAQSLYASGKRDLSLDELAARLDREGWQKREQAALSAQPAIYLRYAKNDIIDDRVLTGG